MQCPLLNGATLLVMAVYGLRPDELIHLTPMNPTTGKAVVQLKPNRSYRYERGDYPAVAQSMQG